MWIYAPVFDPYVWVKVTHTSLDPLVAKKPNVLVKFSIIRGNIFFQVFNIKGFVLLCMFSVHFYLLKHLMINCLC